MIFLTFLHKKKLDFFFFFEQHVSEVWHLSFWRKPRMQLKLHVFVCLFPNKMHLIVVIFVSTEHFHPQ